jgi:hypothetical protein
VRFISSEIQRLYEAEDYPLRKCRECLAHAREIRPRSRLCRFLILGALRRLRLRVRIVELSLLVIAQ